jgi:hypothetical protein
MLMPVIALFASLALRNRGLGIREQMVSSSLEGSFLSFEKNGDPVENRSPGKSKIIGVKL